MARYDAVGRIMERVGRHHHFKQANGKRLIAETSTSKPGGLFVFIEYENDESRKSAYIHLDREQLNDLVTLVEYIKYVTDEEMEQEVPK